MEKSSIPTLIFAIVMGVAPISCDTNTQKGSGTGSGAGQGMMSGGTAWGTGAFRSNGERIYFTATSERGTSITYAGGPSSSGWMMMGGQLACVSCHGPNGRGGKHNMGMTQVMDAKDIRWKVLQPEFDAEKFRLAVVKGQDPDGTQLKPDMPRWNISGDDVADLIVFLKTLP
jgi:hypothetical protein